MYLWIAGLDANSSRPGFPAQITPGADVISNSFGTSVIVPISALTSDTFDTLTDDGRGGAGTLLFFSAGNDAGRPRHNRSTPVGYVRTVFLRRGLDARATMGRRKSRRQYSNWGSTVDFCAPSSSDVGSHNLHNPPTAHGAHTATIQAAPEGEAMPGRPDRRTTLQACSRRRRDNAKPRHLGRHGGGRCRCLIGAPGRGGHRGSSHHRREHWHQPGEPSHPALRNPHGVGTAIVSGPRRVPEQLRWHFVCDPCVRRYRCVNAVGKPTTAVGSSRRHIT